jgi:glyoxylase-like metal-dependent hydrolase (beta-lactamase superfamily II)
MQFLLSVLAAGLVLSGCNRSGNGAGVPERTAAAMGGREAILAVETVRTTASGTLFEPDQTFQPGDQPLTASTFQYTLTEDPVGGRFRYDWTMAVVYPFVDSLAYSEVISGNQGFVDGKDTANGVAARAGMLSVRVATLTKFHRLTSPLALVRETLTAPQAVETRPDEEFNGKMYHVIALPGSVSPVRLFIDPETFLPAKADTLEDDPYYGDTLFEAIYGDWRRVGEIMVPFLLSLRLEGIGRVITMQTEERSSVQNNVETQPGALDIPVDLLLTYDPADALRAERMSQWFLRRQALGLPGYVDQSQPVVFTESSLDSGVWHVAGGSHNSLVVEMADRVIVVEPPLYESRSQAVISEIKTRFPGKPIRTVVVTHFHGDHGGGVRAYAAEGADVIVGAASEAYFRAILVEPHTLVPDALQLNPRQAVVTAVPAAGLPFTDGVKSVNVYPVENTHAADVVIAHVSGENLVFVSDLFSPSGPVTLAALPQSLQTTFTTFGLTVSRIAGGHGTMAPVQ